MRPEILKIGDVVEVGFSEYAYSGEIGIVINPFEWVTTIVLETGEKPIVKTDLLEKLSPSSHKIEIGQHVVPINPAGQFFPRVGEVTELFPNSAKANILFGGNTLVTYDFSQIVAFPKEIHQPAAKSHRDKVRNMWEAICKNYDVYGKADHARRPAVKPGIEAKNRRTRSDYISRKVNKIRHS